MLEICDRCGADVDETELHKFTEQHFGYSLQSLVCDDCLEELENVEDPDAFEIERRIDEHLYERRFGA